MAYINDYVYFSDRWIPYNLGDGKKTYFYDPKFHFDGNDPYNDRISWTITYTDGPTQSSIAYLSNEAEWFDVARMSGSDISFVWTYDNNPNYYRNYTTNTSDYAGPTNISLTLQNWDLGFLGIGSNWKDMCSIKINYRDTRYDLLNYSVYTGTDTVTSQSSNYTIRDVTKYFTMSDGTEASPFNSPTSFIRTEPDGSAHEIRANVTNPTINLPTIRYIDRGFGYELKDENGNIPTTPDTNKSWSLGYFNYYRVESTQTVIGSNPVEFVYKIPKSVSLSRQSSRRINWTKLESDYKPTRYDIYIDGEKYTEVDGNTTTYTLPSTVKGLHKVRVRPVGTHIFTSKENIFQHFTHPISNYQTTYIDKMFSAYQIIIYDSPVASDELIIGQIETPTVKLGLRTSVNSRNVSWTEPASFNKYGTRCKYCVEVSTTDKNGNTVDTSNYYLTNELELTNLKMKNSFSIYVVDETDSMNNSNGIQFNFNLSKIALPTVTKSRTGFNECTITWPAEITYCDTVSISVNGTTDTSTGTIDQSNTKRRLYTKSNLLYGNNTFTLKFLSNIDHEFDSNEYTFTISMDKLDTPRLTTTDYPSSNPNDAYVELSWPNIQFATLYKIYDEYRVYNPLTNEWDTGTNVTSVPATLSQTIKQKIYDTSNSQGSHNIYITALPSDITNENMSYISDFVSDDSNSFEYTHSLLNPPVISYRDNTSIVEWDNVDDDHVDRYLVTTYANGIEDNVVTVEKTDAAVAEHNVYSAVKNPYHITLTYNTYVTSMSNNAFYYYPSTASNVLSDYQAIVLGKATPTFDYNTGIISWNAVDNARGYKLTITSSNGAVEHILDANTTTFDISSYTQDLYNISVKTLGSGDSITDRPYYLDAWETGMISVGILNPPVLTRTNNVLFWESVGADYYDIYQNDVKINTVYDGTSNTDMKTVRAVLDAVPVGTYSYKVKGYYRGNNGELFESNYSNSVSVTVTQLDSPTIEFENGLSIVNWTAVTNAEEYDIYVADDDVFVHQDLEHLTHTVYKNESSPTYYPVTMKAVNNTDHFAYIDSEPSNELQYYVYLLPTPELSLDTVNRRLTWDEVQNSHHYTLTLNGQKIAVSTAYYDITQLDAATYTAFVQASPASTLYPNPRYIESKMSNIVTFGTLSTPVISVKPDSTMLIWDEIENADYYDIYDNGVYMTSTNLNSYTLSSPTPKQFTIYIIAKSNSDSIFDSNASNTIQFTFVKLDQVQNVMLRDSTNMLSWAPVPNSRGYQVCSNGKVIVTLQNEETSYNMTQFMKESIGKQEIYVIAVGEYLSTEDGYHYYLNSDKSNTIIKLVQATQQYNVVINGVNYTSIELPFTYTATIDESLDTCAIKICHINRELPFEAYSDASLCIYDSSLENPSMVVNMLVASDEVTDVQLGNNTLWDHKLTLIERTRLLQSEIMPSFTVTQPQMVINTLGTEMASPKLVSGSYYFNRAESGNMRIEKRLATNELDALLNDERWYAKFAGALGWAMNWSEWLANITGWEWLGWLSPVNYLVSKNCTCAFSYYGLTGPTSIKKEWKVGDSVVLPVEQGEPGYMASIFMVGQSWENVVNEYTTTRKYYVRRHRDNAAYDSNYPETLIATVQGPNTIPTYTFTEAGDYDIILEIDDMVDAYGNRIGLMSTTSDNTAENHIDIVSQPMSSEGALSFISTMKAVPKNFTHYRIVWNVKAVSAYSEDVKYVTIKDTLNKIIDIVEPLDRDETAKYSIKPSVLSRTANLRCPELAIQNGKTLYEVLAILGKEFNGIPRLEYIDGKNVITYDILNETTVFNIAANNFKELNVESQSQSSIDNHSTGFVSNISNLVSDNFVTLYPAGDLYTTARADTSRSAYLDISSMVVEVDQPIYKFCNLFATNVFKNNPDTVVDLTQFVYEKNIYDTLPDTQTGKGLALYYKQGDNKINGLGRLSEASKLYEVLGWSSDTYVIQRIINRLYNLIPEPDEGVANLNNWDTHYNPVQDIQYKVRYVPVVDTVSYIEQSTITDLANYNYKNFNQEDNIVSDSRLFKSANEQLKRLGNNSIQKLYTTFNMSQIPLLGYQTKMNGDVYYIDVVSYEFNNKYIDSSVNYSKNINKINERMGVDSTYRKYEIYGDNYITRTLNFNDYCFIDFKSYPISNKLSVKNWPDVIYDGLYGNGTLVNPQLKPDAFYINACRTKYGTAVQWKDYNNVTRSANGILLSATTTSGLNSIQFSAKMYDNFSAGTATYERVGTSLGGTTAKKKIRDVRYVDSEGKCEYMKVALTRLTPEHETKLKYGSYPLAATLPMCQWIYDSEELFKSTAIFNKNIKLHKDNRERIAFNYQMHFISKHKDIYIGNGLTKYLFKNPSIRYIADTSAQELPIWVGYRVPILSRSTFQGNMVDDKVGNLSITKNSDNNHLTLNGFNYNTSNYIGYALVWPKTGEVLLDVRRPLNGSGRTSDIYLSLSNIKL